MWCWPNRVDGDARVLETLTPDERAVFVLREVFGFNYDEIAGAVGKSGRPCVRWRTAPGSTCRRGASGSSRSIRSGKKQITERFLAAASTGDIDGLMAMLAPDGPRSPMRRPGVPHADRWSGREGGRSDHRGYGGPPDMRFEIVTANSAPAVMRVPRRSPRGVITIEISGGQISHFYAIANPDKLAGDRHPAEISR